MRDFGWFKEKMRFETHHEIYLPAGQCWHIWHIHWIFSTGKPPQKNTQTRNRNLMSTLRYRKRARRYFQGVFGKSLFLYMKSETNEYLRTEDATTYCEVLGDLFLLLFIYWCFMGPCAEVLSCVCYSACFHTISFYGLIFKTLPSLCCSSPTLRPCGLLTSHIWREARSPRHIIEVLTTCLFQFFIIHFALFVLFWIWSFFI